jgi:hypothetical protein
VSVQQKGPLHGFTAGQFWFGVMGVRIPFRTINAQRRRVFHRSNPAAWGNRRRDRPAGNLRDGWVVPDR